MPKDFHELPRLADSISYIYAEHAIIEQSDSSIMLIRKDGKIPLPIAATTCLLLGPGTSITHAAIKAISDNGCKVVWCGEQIGRFYSSGIGETRNAKNILKQAALCVDKEKHLEVVKRMYARRFPKLPEGNYTVQQLRGMEGTRVRECYKIMARQHGLKWDGRNYKTQNWNENDPLNKALSAANALLYGVCHSAVVSLGFSPALGFIHTGKMLSFVYDIADLYKADVTIPAAFEAVKNNLNPFDLDIDVRMICRRRFESLHLLKKIPEDIAWIFDVECEEQTDTVETGDLWDENGTTAGGINYGDY